MPQSKQLGTFTQSGMFAGGMSPTPPTSSLPFSSITGAPSDNTALATALNAKLTATQAAAQANSTAPDVATLVADFNSLLAKLRTAGILAP